MTWTAQVTNKVTESGVVKVTVSYGDGANDFSETYRSQNPTVNWIPDTVRNRIVMLDVADAYDIPIGLVTPSEPVAPTDERLFRSRCRALEIVKVMIDLGVVASDNPKILALISWITNNYDEYFDTLGG